MKYVDILIEPPELSCHVDITDMIIHLTARYFGYDPESLRPIRLDYKSSMAIQLAVHLARLYTRATYVNLSPYFNRSSPYLNTVNTLITARIGRKDRYIYSHYLALMRLVNEYVDSIYPVDPEPHKPRIYQLSRTPINL